MRLIITRHGETEENIAGIMMGHLQGKLSATGIEQAKKVALRLKDEKIDFIFQVIWQELLILQKKLPNIIPTLQLNL